jgi:hypothetical protein
MKVYSFKDCEGSIESVDFPQKAEMVVRLEDDPPLIRWSEICEVISRASQLGTKPMSAKEVWESSPSGELWHLFGWYQRAVWILGVTNDDIMSDIHVQQDRLKWEA